MPLPAQSSTAQLQAVYTLYAALLRDADATAGLGGRLAYAGALDTSALNFIRAATTAGAAALTATQDAATLRAALRDNAIHFQVTSLDEALRILKNEIRKRQPVAVAIAADPTQVAAEMHERGVVADLLAPAAPSLALETEFLAFAIPESFALRAAAFDEQLLAQLPENDALNRRWYRGAPRVFGRELRNLRSLGCSAETALRLRVWLQQQAG